MKTRKIMIYIENLEHRLVKYEVKVDEDKLCSLRDEITIKHGSHKHKTYKSDKYCTPLDLIKDPKKVNDVFINNFSIVEIPCLRGSPFGFKII